MDHIIERVRKLLNVADPRSGATEAEMATALAMAQALMMKHNIEQSELVETPEGCVVAYVKGDISELYHEFAAQAASHMNMVKLFRSPALESFGFIGRKSNCDATAIMYQYIVSRVETLYKQNLPKGLTKRARADFRRSFKQACAGRVLRRAMEIMERQQREGVAASQGYAGSTALVVQSTVKQRLEEAQEHMEKEFPNMRVSRAKKVSVGLGTILGHQAGDQIELQKAVR